MLARDSGGGDFEQPEAGSYAAVCTRIIDLGTQTGEYQGKPITKRQLIITWEIDEKMSDGKAFFVSKFYTLSLNEKANLRHDLDAWRGIAFTAEELKDGFPLKDMIGKACLLSLVAKPNDPTKVKVGSVSKLPKGMTPPASENPSVYFSLDSFDQHVFGALSDGFKKMILLSPEFKKLADDGTAVPF